MPFTKKDAHREFIAWTKAHDANWPIGEVTVNGAFSHFYDAATDDAWIGFEAAWRILGEKASPSDMVTVPREPTQSMIEAGYGKSSGSGNIRGVYAAMLEVAPPAPTHLVEDLRGFLFAILGADTWMEAGAIWEGNPIQRKAAYAALASKPEGNGNGLS